MYSCMEDFNWLHAGIISSLSYLGDGSCVLDYFNEAGVRPSGNAAVRDESKVQSLLLPQLVTVPVSVRVCVCVCVCSFIVVRVH